MKGIRIIRTAVRCVLSLVFSFGMYLIAAGLFMRHRSNRLRRFHAFRPGTRFWARGIAFIWGMRIRVTGPVPEPPFYLVSNHISYTDVILMLAICPAWIVSKSEVADWPGIGRLTRMGLTIFINRETRRDVQRANRLICSLVQEGGAVIFFPEGTTSEGGELLPFKTSLFQPAIDLSIPVSTAVVSYETPSHVPPPSENVAWTGNDSFLPHLLHLLGLPGFTAHIHFSDQPVKAENRKALSKKARQQMESLTL